MLQQLKDVNGVSDENGTIRRLNDGWRMDRKGRGKVAISTEIQRRGNDYQDRVLNAIKSFDDFTVENDPLGEHDFGSLRIDGERIVWRIDYYDAEALHLSDHPADADRTTRVLRVMLASEY